MLPPSPLCTLGAGGVKNCNFFAVRICVNINVCGWWWKAGGPGAAETLPNLSWPYLPHSSLSWGWCCMHVCVCVWLSDVMKIPYVAHQTWLTLAVLTTHCSSWSGGPLRLHTHKHTYAKPREKKKKKTNVSPLDFLQGDTVTGWTVKPSTFKTLWDNFLALLSLNR